MKFSQYALASIFLSLILSFLGCTGKTVDEDQTAETRPSLEEQLTTQKTDQPATLPVRFQSPGYVTAAVEAMEDLDKDEEEYHLKVGATIRSTSGAQPLWDILSRLAALKGMSVSWAGDVDRNVRVDVNIAADDDFFIAIDNLLRQVDYFKEMEGNTIVVKYRETRKFYIAIPNMKGNYTTTVGGNYLTDREAATGTEGTVKITSDGNEFDVWQNIQKNISTIMTQWSTTLSETPSEAAQNRQNSSGGSAAAGQSSQSSQEEAQATRRIASSGSYYTIDKSIGLVTVTAPRPLLDKVQFYINTIKKELFRQVVIEAKIVEVYLKDNSKIGLDWSSVLKDFTITGTTFFGTAGHTYTDSDGNEYTGDGQIYPWNSTDDDSDSDTRFISKLTLDTLDFSVVLNALNEQGDATVLSNPKLTVLNGQPAVISVGTDIAYIKEVEADRDSDDDTVTYTVETDSIVEGVALGVLPTIVNDESVILHLTPITTDLVVDPIEYRDFGTDGAEVGLPRVRVRQMSTMVEVHNGEMLVIGGLIDSVEEKENAFAPLVGSIPVLKYLFGYEEKQLERREMVILLTPRVL